MTAAKRALCGMRKRSKRIRAMVARHKGGSSKGAPGKRAPKGNRQWMIRMRSGG